jgi:hypothetical protein
MAKKTFIAAYITGWQNVPWKLVAINPKPLIFGD